MQVIGLSNEQIVRGYAKDRPFRANEYLIVHDNFTGEDFVGQVIQTEAYNTMQDVKSDGSTLADPLRLLGGINNAEHTFYQSVIKLLDTADTPIQPGSPIREPKFEEIKHLLLHGHPRDGLVLGMIKATENMGKDLPADLRHIMYLITKEGKVVPQEGIPFIFPIKEMDKYPHIGIFGGSGSGKSYTLRVVMEELMRLGIPMLVFDPHNEMTFFESPPHAPQGYRDFPFEEAFRVFKIGENCGADFTEISTPDLVQLLGAAIKGAFTDHMRAAIESLHKKGDSLTSFKARLDAVIDIKEGKEVKYVDATGGIPAIDAPLSSLKSLRNRLNRLENSKVFNYGIKEIVETLAEGKTAVIQGPDFLMQVMAAYAANSLYRLRREYVDAHFRGEEAPWYPPFVVVADEAHNLAMRGDENRSPASRFVLREISQEGRKYGVFLVLATQRPALLDETITAQLNTKIICRTVRQQDIAIIAQETDLTAEETKNLPKLRSGHYYISSAIFGRTFSVQGRMAKTSSPHRPNPFDELRQIQRVERRSYQNELAPIFARLEDQRLTTANMVDAMEIYMKLHNKSIQPVGLLKMVESLVKDGVVEKREGFAGDVYVWVGPLPDSTVPALTEPAAASGKTEDVASTYRELLRPVFAELPERRYEEGTIPMAVERFTQLHGRAITPTELTAMVELLAARGVLRREESWLGVIYYWAEDVSSLSTEAPSEPLAPAAEQMEQGSVAEAEPPTKQESRESAAVVPAAAAPSGEADVRPKRRRRHREAAVTPAAPDDVGADAPRALDPERVIAVLAQLPHQRLDAALIPKALTIYHALYGVKLTEAELLQQLNLLVERGRLVAYEDFLGKSYLLQG